ncbi:unnamed protein product [Polarella glacialis]|uniref:Uncharacterized protein n=1 Tax=Polarella glacialis TaxID=89957 RepID=A0A813IG68_POLGL|nr:unnamed protein product [Polarella glacialis]
MLQQPIGLVYTVYQTCTCPSALYCVELLVFRKDWEVRINGLQEKAARRILGLIGPVPRVVLLEFCGWSLRLSSLLLIRASMLWFRARLDSRHMYAARVFEHSCTYPDTWASTVKKWLETLQAGLSSWQPPVPVETPDQLRSALKRLRQETLLPLAVAREHR